LYNIDNEDDEVDSLDGFIVNDEKVEKEDEEEEDDEEEEEEKGNDDKNNIEETDDVDELLMDLSNDYDENDPDFLEVDSFQSQTNYRSSIFGTKVNMKYFFKNNIYVYINIYIYF